MVALKPGAPLGQDRHQPAVSDIFIRNIFWKAGYTQAIKSGIKLMYRAVRNILPLHLQAELLVFLLEFPGIQTTRVGIPDVDAVVVQKILRFFRLAITLKIIRCCNNQLPPVLADFNGNHIIIQRISGADPRIKTLINDVGKSICSIKGPISLISLSPASVVEILRVVLASNLIPSLSSRDFTVWLTAEGVTPISAAALVKLLSLATLKKTFSSSTLTSSKGEASVPAND